MHERVTNLRELTLRGLVLGALITVVFTAANVYLGLKIGLTFASSIPAAVISMAALRVVGGATILENNIVQTEASAAGTLSSIIFVLPGLVMIGHWHGFPFWQSAAICLAGGVMGVLFTIPLRRAMVVGTDLPFPEGVAAAEILRVGSAEGGADGGARDIAAGSLLAAAVSFAASGLHVLADGADAWFRAGPSIFRLSTGFSLALMGAGYLVGIAGGLAMLLGAVLSWGIAVPWLSALHPAPPGADIAAFATTLWAQKVRFIGAGIIGVAAIHALANLAKPTIDGMRASLRRIDLSGAPVARTEQDIAPRYVLALFVASLLVMAWALYAFAAGIPALAGVSPLGLAFACALFAALFGFLVAAACGYMAGLVGSSSSPISGIAILATLGGSLMLLAVLGAAGVLNTPEGRQGAVALVLFTVTAILATATISNNNLQDLKTGVLVGATPAKQQIALLVGCIAGAAVIPPVLDLLYTAYGFPGALPRAGMDPAQALAAPQATLMSKIAQGVLGGTLEWRFIGIGAVLALLLIGVDLLLRRTTRARLHVLAVGIGLYLPPTVGVTLAIGAVLGWLTQRRAAPADREETERRGTLIASGFIVGESLVGVVMAAIIGASGSQAPLALVGPGFATPASLLGLAVFAGIFLWVLHTLGRPQRQHP